MRPGAMNRGMALPRSSGLRSTIRRSSRTVSGVTFGGTDRPASRSAAGSTVSRPSSAGPAQRSSAKSARSRSAVTGRAGDSTMLDLRRDAPGAVFGRCSAHPAGVSGREQAPGCGPPCRRAIFGQFMSPPWRRTSIGVVPRRPRPRGAPPPARCRVATAAGSWRRPRPRDARSAVSTDTTRSQEATRLGQVDEVPDRAGTRHGGGGPAPPFPPPSGCSEAR